MINIRIRRFLFLILYFVSFAGMDQMCAQTFLEFKLSEPLEKKYLKLLPDSKQADSVTAIRKLNKLTATFFDEGFLAASIDSVTGTKDTLIVFIFTGKKYEWVKLGNGNIDEGVLSEAGFREKFYESKPVKLSTINKLNQKILGYCEDHGYPFASLQYRDFNFTEQKIGANLYLTTDKRITIDSVIVRGESKLSKTYLYNYLSIKPGDWYNESVIRKISSRLKELPMVTETKPFNIAFTEETARVILQLEDKKASQVDGIIGILPDNSQTGKVQVTGDLRIRLLSSFGKGELFDLNWKQPQSKTQDLKVKLNYPFLFSTPFGIDLNLGIYKKDSSYLEVILGAGIQFLLKGGNYLKVFVNKKESSLLSTDIYENLTVLPPYADISLTSYGLGFRSLKLDYRLKQYLSKYMSSFFARQGIDNNFNFKIVINFLELIDNEKSIPIYMNEEYANRRGPSSANVTDNFRKKRVSEILVKGDRSENNFYRLDFDCYIDFSDKQKMVTKETSVSLILVALSIIVVVALFLVTYKNLMEEKRLSNLKTDFINNMTHELKTPLSTITVAGKTLEMEQIRKNDAKILETARLIGKQSIHLNQLINMILEISMWERTQFQLDKKVVSIDELMDDVIESFKSGGGSNATINEKYNFQGTKADLDIVYFTTMVNNLLSNAVKYSDKIPVIDIEGSFNENSIAIKISDNGIGINKTDQKHIFDKFYRATTGNIHKFKGLGLGLYYVKKIAEAHGGDVAVSSKPGKGSSFTVTLPKA